MSATADETARLAATMAYMGSPESAAFMNLLHGGQPGQQQDPNAAVLQLLQQLQAGQPGGGASMGTQYRIDPFGAQPSMRGAGAFYGPGGNPHFYFAGGSPRPVPSGSGIATAALINNALQGLLSAMRQRKGAATPTPTPAATPTPSTPAVEPDTEDQGTP